LLYDSIKDLRLAVRLWMVRSAKSFVNPKALADLSPEGRGELRATVRDDLIWQTMEAEYMFNKQIAQGTSVDI